MLRTPHGRLTQFVQVVVAILSLGVAGLAHAQLAPTVVVAGPNTVQANGGDFVSFDASGSTDPNNPASPLTFLWSQIAGPPAEDFVFNTPIFDLITPFNGGAAGSVIFQVTVTNAFGLSSSTTVTVQIKAANRPPVASIVQPSQPYAAGSTVALDASATFDPDGDALNYSWLQISGPPVVLNLTNPAIPTFVAPILPTLTTYEFIMDVNDGQDTETAVVILQTLPGHNPPLANAGAAERLATVKA